MENESTDEKEPLSCREVRDLLYLYVCDELEAEEKPAVEEHLKSCQDCQSALAEHRILNRALPVGFVNRKLFYYSSNN